jgi:hypothetical protein
MPSDLKHYPEQEYLHQLLIHLGDLPPHDPTRFETTDGFENPSCTNGDRASFAATALDAFQQSCGTNEDISTDAGDLICDLLHLLHANQHDPRDVLRSGIQHFLCEAGKITVTPP